MQRNTFSPRPRLCPGLRRGLTRASALPAALLTASSLLLAAAPASVAQSGGWEHYEIGEPRVITLNFDTDLLAWDLCWSDHTAMARTQVANAAVAQMNDPARLYVIDMPGLPPFYRRTSNAPIWYDLVGEQITSNNVLPNRWNYHLDVEQALIDIAAQIREQRPGAKLAFKNFEVQPLHNRPAAYTELGEVQDFYITDRTIYLNHVGHMLNHALNSAFYRARVDFANEANNWLVFPDSGGKFALASNSGLDWPPAEFEPEILALWGGDDEPEGGGGGGLPDLPDLPPGNFHVLQPGSGWTGPTEEPAAIGHPSDLGYDAKAIARWDVVPFQTFDEAFDIGVVAFHMNGIERVEFAVEGGPWVPVSAPEYNARTGVIEYTVRLEPSLFADGKVEVRAIAYPVIGEPRVLDSLELFANAGGSLTGETVYVSLSGEDSPSGGSLQAPFASLAFAIDRAGSGGEVILLDPGFYQLPGRRNLSNDTWVTIRGHESLAREDVIVGNVGERRTCRPYISRVRYANLTMDFANISQYYPESSQHVWFDSARWIDSNGWAHSYSSTHLIPIRNSENIGGYFVTDSIAQNMTHGFVDAVLVRNSLSNQISGDAYLNNQFVVNCSVDLIDGSVKGHHTDLIQLYTGRDNLIYYGIVAKRVRETQNLFLNALNTPDSVIRNVAFVNIAVENEVNDVVKSQFNTSHDHVLFLHVSTPGQQWIFRDDWTGWRRFEANNVLIMNSVVRRMTRGTFGWAGLPVGLYVTDNHFESGETHGSFASSGPVQLQFTSANDFTYTGSAANLLVGSGSVMTNLPVADWDFGTPLSPNRGAFPHFAAVQAAVRGE